jgi:hypothetical protein
MCSGPNSTGLLILSFLLLLSSSFCSCFYSDDKDDNRYDMIWCDICDMIRYVIISKIITCHIILYCIILLVYYIIWYYIISYYFVIVLAAVEGHILVCYVGFENITLKNCLCLHEELATTLEAYVVYGCGLLTLHPSTKL